MTRWRSEKFEAQDPGEERGRWSRLLADPSGPEGGVQRGFRWGRQEDRKTCVCVTLCPARGKGKENSCFLSLAPQSFLVSSACTYIIPISASVFTCVKCCVRVSPTLLLSVKMPVFGVRAHHNPTWLLLSMVTCAKTPFPNRVMFQGSGGHESFGDTIHSNTLLKTLSK